MDIKNKKIYVIDINMYNNFIKKISCIRDGIEDLSINNTLDPIKKILYAELHAEYYFYITFKFKEKAYAFYLKEIEEEITKVLMSDNILLSAEVLIKKLKCIKVLRGTDFLKEKLLELRYIALKHDDINLYSDGLLHELKPLLIKEALMLINDETISLEKREGLKDFLTFNDLNNIKNLIEAYKKVFEFNQEEFILETDEIELPVEMISSVKDRKEHYPGMFSTKSKNKDTILALEYSDVVMVEKKH